MLLAVLHRHGGISMHDMDVYVNVVGGLKISETASDLAVLAAAVSSLRGVAIPPDTVIIGEIGLAGELRPVANGEARIKAAEQHGFKRIILPQANAPRKKAGKLTIYSANTLSEALEQLKEME
ncbi:DNA repair protein RadA [Suttonella ornithocola]|uniref:DNA repair protein RadA n=2 Tax=Suttonella ornithocola TaxID=279832 RepID=A0A380MRT3_9GAMM|nr:magnesium chelatase domain-containing protein [Suttonella ornithocola]SUO94421.1 DNA repair protein RadA [Suttonella ornithocola]